MSPIKKKKLDKLRKELDKLDNSLIKIILVISNNPDAEGLKYASRSKIKIYGNKNKSNFEKKRFDLELA